MDIMVIISMDNMRDTSTVYISSLSYMHLYQMIPDVRCNDTSY